MFDFNPELYDILITDKSLKLAEFHWYLLSAYKMMESKMFISFEKKEYRLSEIEITKPFFNEVRYNKILWWFKKWTEKNLKKKKISKKKKSIEYFSEFIDTFILIRKESSNNHNNRKDIDVIGIKPGDN